MVDELNYGTCRECIVRDRDHSEKQLHKCSYCRESFCVEHLEPKPVYIRDYGLYSKYPEFWIAIQKEIEVEGRHPCFQFTKKWVKEKDQELRLQKKLLMDWLDRSKTYRPVGTPHLEKELKAEIARMPPEVKRGIPPKPPRPLKLGECPECGSTDSKMEDYDAKTISYICNRCSHTWTQSKASPHKIIKFPRVKPAKVMKEEFVIKEKPIRHSPFRWDDKPKRKLRTKARDVLSSVFSVLKGIGVIVVLVFLGIYLLGCFPFYHIIIEGIVIPINAERIDLNLVEAEIFRLINEHRNATYRPVLKNSPLLAKASKEWSEYLAENNVLTHGNFGGRMVSVGFSPSRCGEIAEEFPLGSVGYLRLIYPGVDETYLAEKFVDGWINSAGHLEVMETARFDHMGVGVSRNGGTYYGVVDFCDEVD